jgi:exodeoxyribonuclease-3
MKIATFNVNSIRQRIAPLNAWLAKAKPDLCCLQELKCTDESFPHAEFEASGYSIATLGQKTFNGVAIFSRHPIEIEARGLPGFEDDQARYIEGVVSLADGRALRIASVYCPNGNPVDPGGGGPKYAYKRAFMAAFEAHARRLLALDEITILAGDYNIIPEDRDAKSPGRWHKDALGLPESRARFRRLIALGYACALRACTDEAGIYSFWDYQAGAWPKNDGIRIDHLLLSPRAADCLGGAGVATELRGGEKPSDHVPVWCELRDA